jgi:alcohol dehydrogenase
VDYEAGMTPITKPGPAIFSIPTTAGTGSEATFWSVITDQQKHRKFDVGSPLMAAAVSFVDPLLTLSMPPSVTAATGMDAMCHAVEAYVTQNAGPVTDALAIRAIELVAQNLPTAFADGSHLEARGGTILGSMTAGMAFANAGLGAVHGVTAPLGGHFGVPHGVANAIMLPEVMDFNLEVRTERYGDIALALGAGKPDAREAVKRVRKLNADLGLPSLDSYGITEEDLDMLAEDSIGPNSNCNANPRPVTKQDCIDMFRAALKGQL